VNITYAVQERPDGLAQAFVVGANHIGNETVALVLGDNIFYGPGLGASLQRFQTSAGGAIFAYWVANPSDYGVVEFGSDGTALSLEQKPAAPKSHYRGARPVLLRQRRHRDRALAEEVGARRIRDHRDQPDVPQPGPAESRGARPRHRVARHRNIRLAWRVGFIDDQLASRAKDLLKSGYGAYLLGLLER
jgi:glucose-1-phosphate thymidylyltransferase